MSENTVILTIGLPGSGKTTWAKHYVEKNDNFIRISRNDIRSMFGKKVFSKQREALVSIIESSAVRGALKKGFNIIIDANNLNPKVVTKWVKFVERYNDASDHQISLQTIFFSTSLEECIRRDANRQDPDEIVGVNIIKNMYTKYFVEEEESLPGVGHNTFNVVIESDWFERNNAEQ